VVSSGRDPTGSGVSSSTSTASHRGRAQPSSDRAPTRSTTCTSTVVAGPKGREPTGGPASVRASTRGHRRARRPGTTRPSAPTWCWLLVPRALRPSPGDGACSVDSRNSTRVDTPTFCRPLLALGPLTAATRQLGHELPELDGGRDPDVLDGGPWCPPPPCAANASRPGATPAALQHVDEPLALCGYERVGARGLDHRDQIQRHHENMVRTHAEAVFTTVRSS